VARPGVANTTTEGGDDAPDPPLSPGMRAVVRSSLFRVTAHERNYRASSSSSRRTPCHRLLRARQKARRRWRPENALVGQNDLGTDAIARFIVIAGLDPAIHARPRAKPRPWMVGSSPTMTRRWLFSLRLWKEVSRTANGPRGGAAGRASRAPPQRPGQLKEGRRHPRQNGFEDSCSTSPRVRPRSCRSRGVSAWSRRRW
jgi:hypothetical protein